MCSCVILLKLFVFVYRIIFIIFVENAHNLYVLISNALEFIEATYLRQVLPMIS